MVHVINSHLVGGLAIVGAAFSIIGAVVILTVPSTVVRRSVSVVPVDWTVNAIRT